MRLADGPRLHALAAACAACVLVFASTALAARAGDDGPGPTASRPIPTPSPTPRPPPLKLAFSRKGPDNNEPKNYIPVVKTIHQDGTHERKTKDPVVRPDQISKKLGRIVYSKTIDTNSNIRQDCYVAGCPMRFSSSTEAGIAVAHLDGSHERLLTKGGYDVDPRFSPQGDLIAYRSHRVPKGGYADKAFDVVVVLDRSTGDEQIVVADESFTITSFAWSPDGISLAVLRDKLETNVNHEPEIVIYPLYFGQKPKMLVKENLYDELGDFSDLDWSHDGRHLVAARDSVWRPGESSSYPYWARFSRGSDLWLIPLRGGGPRPLTRFAPYTGRGLDNSFCQAGGGVVPRVATPLWSPDDKKIAFLSSYPHVKEFARVSDIMVIRPDGGGLRTVRKTPHAYCPSGPINATRQVNPETIELLGWTR